MLKERRKNSDKKSDKKYTKVCGCDEYGREAWIMVENDKKSGKIGILSSEEGSAVVYTQKQVKELIETLKKCL